MGEDKDMKKIISILILLLSLTGLYALNPPAWMMGYWFRDDTDSSVKYAIMQVTPDNVSIKVDRIIGLDDFHFDINDDIDSLDLDYAEEYTDDSYTVTLRYRNTGKICYIYSFSHDTIDNMVILYSWVNNRWLYLHTYGRDKPAGVSYSDFNR